jgi:hypothetical protein
MTDLLKPVKTAVKETPLWPVLRPRRIHAYNLGMGRTGTTAVASIFSSFRSTHEPFGRETISVLEKYWDETLTNEEVRAFLQRRDRVHRFEFESTPFLGPFADHLAHLFPEAKFLLSVRAPHEWLRSVIDKCINTPRSGHPPHIVKHRDLCHGAPPDRYPEQERPLARHNLHTLRGFLRYWGWHNQHVLNSIPSHRLLVIPTNALNDSISIIGDFVGVEPEDLVQPGRKNQSSTRNSILKEIDEEYLQELIERHCREAMVQVNEELSNQGFEPFSPN